MEYATLVLEVRKAVVVIGIAGRRAGVTMVVCRNGMRRNGICPVDVEDVLAHRGHDCGDLGEHKEPQQESSQMTSRADERHAAST